MITKIVLTVRAMIGFVIDPVPTGRALADVSASLWRRLVSD
jgi:hypothetical protein